MKQIHIGSASIPLDDYAIGGTAILGIRASGKSYTAKGIAEQLLDYKIPIVVFDAIGTWRWLKVAGDGPQAHGYKVVVAGGESPDLPLTVQGASEIVRAAIRENISLVVDFYSHALSKGDWSKIVRTCFHTLLYENVGVRHVFLEESAEFVPQKVWDGETYAAVEKLVRMGGNKSLGITLINQRAQEVNKAVLDLCENCILLRQRGSHAIDSLEKWMDRLSPDQGKQIAASMPNMGQGECWVFPGDKEEAVRTKSKPIHSFHPDRKKPGSTAGRATADTGEFITRMKTDLTKLLEEQKASDPVALKAENAKLKRELERKQTTAPGLAPSVAEAIKAAEQRGYTKGFNAAVSLHDKFSSAVATRSEALHAQTIKASESMAKSFEDLKNFIADKRGISSTTVVPSSLPLHINMNTTDILKTALRDPLSKTSIKTNGALPIGERKTLAALIQYSRGLRREQLTVLTGYKRSSRDAYIQRLREKGFVDTSGELIMATDDGRAALPNAEPLPTGRDLQEFWMQRLPIGERKTLEFLISKYPDSVSRETLSEQTEYKRSSRDAYVARLKAKELVTGSGDIKASENLF